MKKTAEKQSSFLKQKSDVIKSMRQGIIHIPNDVSEKNCILIKPAAVQTPLHFICFFLLPIIMQV